MNIRFLNTASCLFFSVIFLYPSSLLANFTENDNLAAVKLSIYNIAKDNNFILQCIIALLLVIIFGYSAKLLYERKVNRK